MIKTLKKAKMMTRLSRTSLVLFLTVLGGTTLAVGQNAPPAIPPTPAPVQDVISIQRFNLETPASHLWRAEKPTVRTGYVLVLKVDPALVFPRQVAEPVLYVGNQTAERINVGYESGHVVAIVPAVTDPEHPEYMDMSKALIWFGSPELPERVTAKRIAQERDAALAAGITPFAQAKITQAREKGGALNAQASKRTLYRDAVRRLVRTYSPQERQLIDSALRADR